MCSLLIFVQPGETPRCPMTGKELIQNELVPLENPGDITGYTAVTLSPERQQMIGIRTAKVVMDHATKTVRTVGRIAYDSELYQAQEEYLQALGAYKKAQMGEEPEIVERALKLVNSTKTRLEIIGLNQELIKEIEAAGAPDKSLLLASPGGTVWLYAHVYEQDLDLIKVGQKIVVSTSSVAAGKLFHGSIRAIDTVLDPKTRSVRIRAKLDNPEGLLKPNVYVDVEVQIELGDQILIPETAVLDSGERQIAFVAKGDGIYEPRRLKLGPLVGSKYVVLAGVKSGEAVVDQATFFVDSESKLKAAVGQAGGGAHAGHGG